MLGIAVLGLLFTDINFISVAKFWRALPGGYWFFIVGALVEGSLGGKSIVPILLTLDTKHVLLKV